MKNYILILFLFFSISSFATQVLVPQRADGGAYVINANPGDTFVIRSAFNNWDYITFHGINGDPAHPFVIINSGGQVIVQKDIRFEDCSAFKLTGSGSSDLYGFSSDGNSGARGGAGVTITGKGSDIEIERVYVHDRGLLGSSASGYGIWCKDEIAYDHPCDSSYIWRNRFLHISIHDCKFVKISQDVFYCGSSDPWGTTRTVTCGGTVYHYRPAGGGWWNFYNDTIIDAGRSGFQIGTCDTGQNSIHDNYIYNMGYEYNSSQGAGIALGGANTNFDIYNNTIRCTWKEAVYSYHFGLARFHDNTYDSSGFCWADGEAHTGLRTQGGQGSQSQYTFNPNSNQLHGQFNTPYDSTTTFQICNNTAGRNTTNWKILLYPGNCQYALTGSTVQGNGAVYDGGQACIHYTLSCTSAVPVCTNNILPVNGDTIATQTTATLQWAAANDATSYDVYYKTQFGSFGAPVNTASTSLNLTGLTADQTYTWYVTPKNATGDAVGCISDTTIFTTAPVQSCTPPTELVSYNISEVSASVSWAATGADNYDIAYKVSGTSTWTPAATGSTYTYFTLGGLVKSTAYRWRVRSNCSGSHSSYVSARFTTRASYCR